MARDSTTTPVLIRWTKHTPGSNDVQDPLGTSLRGSTRLANQLLFCITSITPRARYFSFFPWCVYDHQRRAVEEPSSFSLRDAIIHRERALTLGCVLHHDGAGCDGPGLVGVEAAKKLYESGMPAELDLRKQKLAKNPALDAYLNSLVNLGCFITEEEQDPEDFESGEAEEPVEMTFDDLELSELGQQLASAYDRAVGTLPAAKAAGSNLPRCAPDDTKDFGRSGGLCELTHTKAPDRSLLRDVFFRRIELPGKTHSLRRDSLLLMLHLAEQLGDAGQHFDRATFGEALYYRELRVESEQFGITLPPVLETIANRWRMFYFHYYMATSLESAFRWLVNYLDGFGHAGQRFDQLILSLKEDSVSQDLKDYMNLDLKTDFAEATPASLFHAAGINMRDPMEDAGEDFDRALRADHPTSEVLLDRALRSSRPPYDDPNSEWAISLILMFAVLARYQRWKDSRFGDWLATAAKDPYLDLVPPLVSNIVEQRTGSWWTTPVRELAPYLLHRFVIQQHQSMSFEKSASGARCLIQMDGDVLFSTGGQYESIGISNARFASAAQVLTDLGLLKKTDNKSFVITEDGRRLLANELKSEASL